MNVRHLTFALVTVTVLAACGRDGGSASPRTGLHIAQLLGSGDTAGFARATAPPDLRFPRDHGPHPEFRTEWWYVTANLDAEGGARFGVQLVFFRQALAPTVAPRPATLSARDVVLAHAALTDVAGRRFFAEERLARLAGGLAEIEAGDGQPFRIACADWSMAAAGAGDGFLPLDLRAGGSGFSFDLRVAPGKPIVLQGDRGLSQKSAEPGNASIYYSLTRLPIAGSVVVAGRRQQVSGLAWFDREWSTSALGPDQVGWDWFSLQLDSGEEVMWYRLRRTDGSADAHSRGCFVARDGTTTVLAPDAVTATPLGSWTADDGAARYPARWRLSCREPAFDLEVEPLLPDQELVLLVRYWEGAVAVRGSRAGAPVAGRGYLEMTGYTLPR